MISPTKLFYETAPGQNRLAFFGPSNLLMEVWFDALHRPNLMGTVHQVRINRVFAPQNRAAATLANGETISLRLRKHDIDSVSAGAVMPATIIAAPRHGKPWQAIGGARLVTKEMILLVGLPDYVGTLQLSSQISKDLRKPLLAKLKAESLPILPKGFGLILRRGGASLIDFGATTAKLIKIWKAGTNNIDINNLGVIFDSGNMLARARRLVGNVNVINESAIEFEMSAILDETIASALKPKWPLKCGGQLWCEQTHAVWTIDLDGNAVKDLSRLCDEAATEITRQIRLRGMSGPILLDVPRLPPSRAAQFTADLKKLLGCDPRQPEFLGITRSGLIELRVPHGEMTLGEVMGEQIAQESLAALRLVKQHPGYDEVTLAVSPAMAEWLNGSGRGALEQLDRPVRLSACLDSAKRQMAHIIGKNIKL